jgi:hypothetical protein
MIDRATPPDIAALQGRKPDIAAAWLARTLLTYPEQTVGFLCRERDPFRNPVGHALAASLPLLVDELLGEMDPARLTTALEPIVKIRAVQDFTPRQAVGFVFLLRPIIREGCGKADAGAPADPRIEARIDEMALLAFDLYMACRERLHEVRAGEARRTGMRPVCARPGSDA